VLSINFETAQCCFPIAKCTIEMKVLGDGEWDERLDGEGYVGQIALTEKMRNLIGCRAMRGGSTPLKLGRCGGEMLGCWCWVMRVLRACVVRSKELGAQENKRDQSSANFTPVKHFESTGDSGL
jgi:hypothetical protein